MSDFLELDSLEYSFADECPTAGQDLRVPEQTLWCAVINQALADALNGSIKARDWLLCEKEEFILVCTLAGISPFCVRTAARRLTTKLSL